MDDTGELVIGLRLAGSVYRFWMLRGGLGEARHWLERALPRSVGVPVEVRAKALNAAGCWLDCRATVPRRRRSFAKASDSGRRSAI